MKRRQLWSNTAHEPKTTGIKTKRTQKGKNADFVDMIKKTVYTLCVTVLN